MPAADVDRANADAESPNTAARDDATGWFPAGINNATAGVCHARLREACRHCAVYGFGTARWKLNHVAPAGSYTKLIW